MRITKEQTKARLGNLELGSSDWKGVRWGILRFRDGAVTGEWLTHYVRKNEVAWWPSQKEARQACPPSTPELRYSIQQIASEVR